MPADTDTPVDQPQHPTPALTTSELSRYRCQLEHALNGKTLSPTAPVRVQLQEKLDEVLAEEAERVKIAGRG